MAEVEKKFILTDEQRKVLLLGANFSKEKNFTDVYFDTDDYRLTRKDYWLRTRGNNFELKAPLATENYAVDHYDEITEEESIVKHLQILFPEVNFVKDNRDLTTILRQLKIKPFASINTSRKTYTKDGFTLDLDIATADGDFSHSVAEIELLVPDDLRQKAERDIFSFARKHNLPTDVRVRGKLVEFIYQRRPDHYRALVDAKVILE